MTQGRSIVDRRGRDGRVVEQAPVLERTDGRAVHLDEGLRRDDLKVEHRAARNECEPTPTQDAHDVLSAHSSERPGEHNDVKPPPGISISRAEPTAYVTICRRLFGTRRRASATASASGSNANTLALIVIGAIWAWWRQRVPIALALAFLVLSVGQLAALGDTEKAGGWVNGLHGLLALVALVTAAAYLHVAMRHLGLGRRAPSA